MENKNKPQWLIDAENEIKGFEASKYGKMSSKELNISERSKIHGGVMQYVKDNPEHQKKAFAKMIEKNPNHQSEAGKKGGRLGAIAAHKSMLEKYGEDGLKQLRKDQFKNSKIDKESFHKAGAKKSHENRRIKLDLLLDQIILELPEYFTVSETKNIMVNYGKNPGYFADVKRQRPDNFIIHKKGVKGRYETIYKKIETFS